MNRFISWLIALQALTLSSNGKEVRHLNTVHHNLSYSFFKSKIVISAPAWGDLESLIFLIISSTCALARLAL